MDSQFGRGFIGMYYLRASRQIGRDSWSWYIDEILTRYAMTVENFEYFNDEFSHLAHKITMPYAEPGTPYDYPSEVPFELFSCEEHQKNRC